MAVQTSKKEWPKYSWQEVASHNSEESLWVYNFEEVFDVTSFVYEHPGGPHFLRLFAGRDLTHVLPGYHPLTYDDKVLRVLQTYKIGELEGPPEWPRFKTPDEKSIDYQFRVEMKKYWNEKGWPLSCTEPGGGQILIDTDHWVIWGLEIVLYLVMKVFLNLAPESYMSLPMRYVFGFLTGIVRFIVVIHFFHGGCHYGTDPHWTISHCVFEGYFGLSFATMVTEHVVQHHTYTNVLKVDPNAPMLTGPDENFVRLSQYQPKLKQHLWQFLYFPIAGFLMVFDTTMSYAEHHLFGIRKNVRINPNFLSPQFMLLECFGLTFRFWRDIYLPLFYFDVPWHVWLVAHVGYDMGTAFWALVVFLLSHFFEETFFPPLEKDPQTGRMFIPYTYGDVMMRCSLDYGGYWHMILTADLNCHTVHHIAPGLSPSRHLELQPMLHRLAKERNIPFQHKKTIFHSMVSFIKALCIRGRLESEPAGFLKEYLFDKETGQHTNHY